jgi:acetyltransferase-like isoleucine patch superfamily enzyme
MLKRLFNQQEKMLKVWRRFRLKALGVHLDSSCLIGEQVLATLGFANGIPGKIHIAEQVNLEQGVILQAWGGSIFIDKNVFIGPYTVIYGHGSVKIGKDTLIAMHCRILSSNHTIPDRNSRIRSKPDVLLPVTIGEDVWLGAGVTILGGVTVGDGCVVGAGAVVTKDLPPYSIAVGVPAKVVKTRL